MNQKSAKEYHKSTIDSLPFLFRTILFITLFSLLSLLFVLVVKNRDCTKI